MSTRTIILIVALAIVGFAAGRWQGHAPAAAAQRPPEAGAAPQARLWTCSMHPQIRLPAPGKCPICAMDLIPLKSDAGSDLGPRELRLSAAARQLAQVQVAPAELRFVSQELRLVGAVEYDETRLATIAARVGGRLDRLFVDYTGVAVRQGDHLVWMYSPEILAAQVELLQAVKAAQDAAASQSEVVRTSAEALAAAARGKLRLWGLSEEQIAEVIQRGSPSDHIQVNAPLGGIVIQKDAVEGDYIETGMPIYRIADLSRVWVKLDAYESDLPWLRYGQPVTLATETYPGESFTGVIAFVDPTLTLMTRTVKVRVNVPNEHGKLKPGMFVRAVVQVKLAAGGKVIAADLAGKWLSPMHPEVVRDAPGNCPVCGMPLVKAEELGFVSPEPGAANAPLVIPASAPLLTGKRAVVYVQAPGDPSRYAGRELALGPRVGNYYIVNGGLQAGELVVVNGNFKIDSALQIQAKPSMMNPEVESAAAPIPAPAPAPAPRVADVPARFTTDLGTVVTAYLAVQQHLAQDHLAEAQAAARALQERLAAVDMKVLSGPGHVAWMQDLAQLTPAAASVREAKDLAGAREGLAGLSEALAATVRRFGAGLPGKVVRLHCSMAFNNRGADWLQDQETVANPYFGTAMPKCGEVVETLNPGPETHQHE